MQNDTGASDSRRSSVACVGVSCALIQTCAHVDAGRSQQGADSSDPAAATAAAAAKASSHRLHRRDGNADATRLESSGAKTKPIRAEVCTCIKGTTSMQMVSG